MNLIKNSCINAFNCLFQNSNLNVYELVPEIPISISINKFQNYNLNIYKQVPKFQSQYLLYELVPEIPSYRMYISINLFRYSNFNICELVPKFQSQYLWICSKIPISIFMNLFQNSNLNIYELPEFQSQSRYELNANLNKL